MAAEQRGRMAGKLSLSRAWDETRGIFGRDGKLIMSVALALIVLPIAIGALVAPPPTLSGEEPPSWTRLITLAVLLLGIAGQIAITRLSMAPPTTVRDAIALGSRRVLPAFVALLLFALIASVIALPVLLAVAGPDALEGAARGVGSRRLGQAILIVLLLVAALYARFQLFVPVAAGERGGPIRILRRSWDATKGSYWKLFAFVLVTLLLGFILVLYLGQIVGGTAVRAMFGDADPFSVGALVAGIITGIAQAVFACVLSVMLARIYLQLSGPEPAEASVPSSGT